VAKDLGAIDSYESDKDLADDAYIYANVKFQGKQYIFIHGFAGDNPHGTFLTKDFKEVVGYDDLAYPDEFTGLSYEKALLIQIFLVLYRYLAFQVGHDRAVVSTRR